VLGNLSGISEIALSNIIELLDDLFQRAADAEEPEDQNFIRHTASLRRQGIELSCSVVSNPAGILVRWSRACCGWQLGIGDELGDAAIAQCV